MRIAIVHESWGAGAARCAKDLEAGLSGKHEVLYFPRQRKETLQTVLEALKEFRPDVVNCHSFYGDLPYQSLAELSVLYATCFTVHDPRPVGTIETACWTCERNDWCLRCPLISGKWRKLLKNRYFKERWVKRRCHAKCAPDLTIITPSAWMGNRLKQQELKRFRFAHIPNGIDTERFQPRPPSRAKFGLPEDGTVLLHSAWHAGEWTINHRKGMRYLAEAFDKFVAPKFPKVYLAVAGESFAPNHPRVRPLGMVANADLPELLSSVDVFVTPTLADNYPYTVIEAMGCGKPVVASNVGGLSEQVVHEKTGLLVPPADAQALGAALIDLLSSPAKLSVFGNAARKKAEAEFGMESFLANYESSFAELVRLRPAVSRTGERSSSPGSSVRKPVITTESGKN